MTITGVYDKKLGAFMPELMLASANVMVAMRKYSDTLERSYIAKHSDDFEIHVLAVLSDDTGAITDGRSYRVCSVTELFDVDKALPQMNAASVQSQE